MAPKTQIRGNCQICGRDQAVPTGSGHMAKHGYTVDNGWFNGVCTGEVFEPLQWSRVETDRMIVQIRAQVAALLDHAAALKAEAVFPILARNGHKLERDAKGHWIQVMMPFAEADKWAQEEAVKAAIFQAESRAKAGASHVVYLGRLADEVHGQQLRVVEVEDTASRTHLRGRSGAPACVAWNASRGRSGRTVEAVDAAKINCPRCLKKLAMIATKEAR